MSDAQTLALIETLERRVAHLEILEGVQVRDEIFAVPVSVGAANVEGVLSTFVRSDHIHADALVQFPHDHIVPNSPQDFDKQAWTLYPGSAMTLVLTEAAYIWYTFTAYAEDLTAADAPWSVGFAVYVNGVQQAPQQYFAVAAANWRIGFNTGLQRSDLAQGSGNRVVDLRIWVRTAGHTVRVWGGVGSTFYTRA